jgi:E3 ubiquitin-protein ligase HECTD2
MAPWANRLLPPHSTHHTNERGVMTREHSPSHVTESDILENAYIIPTLAPGARPKRHGRSMSHPFPSLFAGRRKLDGGAAVPGESTDDDAGSASPSPRAKVPDGELVSGKCMTCDSMVRWPRELMVFRCTVCLTINDLKPVALEARLSEGGHRVVKTEPRSVSGFSRSGRFVMAIMVKTG